MLQAFLSLHNFASSAALATTATVILEVRHNCMIPGPACVWRSNPSTELNEASLLSDLHFNWNATEIIFICDSGKAWPTHYCLSMLFRGTQFWSYCGPMLFHSGQGRAVIRRLDSWALQRVIWECLGQNLFQREREDCRSDCQKQWLRMTMSLLVFFYPRSSKRRYTRLTITCSEKWRSNLWSLELRNYQTQFTGWATAERTTMDSIAVTDKTEWHNCFIGMTRKPNGALFETVNCLVCLLHVRHE